MVRESKDNYNQSDNNLDFKDHKQFFDKYYAIRFDFTSNLTKCMTDLSRMKFTYESLNALITWSYSQLINGKCDMDKLKEDMKECFKYISTGKSALAIPKMEIIYQEISKVHEKTELIPKIRTLEKDENERFWRDEESKAMKEIKKAFYDMLMVD